jgi:hypothetical protein
MPLGAKPASVATPRCGIWPMVLCGVLAADRRLCPFRLLRRAQNRNQRARHTDAVGLRDSSATQKHSSATRGLPGGKIPTTGSPTTEDIGQAGLFASSIAQSRPARTKKSRHLSRGRRRTGYLRVATDSLLSRKVCRIISTDHFLSGTQVESLPTSHEGAWWSRPAPPRRDLYPTLDALVGIVAYLFWRGKVCLSEVWK